MFGNLNNYSKQLETSKQSTSIIQAGQTGLTKMSQMESIGSSLFHDERELILEKPELRTIDHFYAEMKVLFLSTVFRVRTCELTDKSTITQSQVQNDG